MKKTLLSIGKFPPLADATGLTTEVVQMSFSLWKWPVRPSCEESRWRLRLRPRLPGALMELGDIHRGQCPSPSSWGPRKTALMRVLVCWVVSANVALRVCDLVRVIVIVRVLSGLLPFCSVRRREQAKRRDKPCGVHVSFWFFDCQCVCDLSVPRPLITSLQRGGAGHGPRHPAVFFSKLCCLVLCFLSESANCMLFKEVCCFGMIC